MLNDLIVQLSGIVLIAFAVTWLGERMRVPIILPLLITGFLIGPVLGWINPDEVLGDLLAPTVSIAVGLILFEGGLSLRLREMEGQQRVLWLLVTVGVLITWLVGSVAAALTTDLNRGMVVLTGSILVVSGPTVIGPLLAAVRPRRSVASILKWESIIIDPIGALLAVITFEVILLGGTVSATPGGLLGNMVQFIVSGVLVGAVIAYGASIALQRHLVTEHLLPLFGLSVALLAFMVADTLAAESGLLATTTLGFILTNQRQLRTEQIIHFSEVIRVLLIGVLFIVLSARLSIEQLRVDLPAAIVVIFAVVLVARPLAVAVSTLKSRLNWRERVLLAGVAPGVSSPLLSPRYSPSSWSVRESQAPSSSPPSCLPSSWARSSSTGSAWGRWPAGWASPTSIRRECLSWGRAGWSDPSQTPSPTPASPSCSPRPTGKITTRPVWPGGVPITATYLLAMSTSTSTWPGSVGSWLSHQTTT